MIRTSSERRDRHAVGASRSILWRSFVMVSHDHARCSCPDHRAMAGRRPTRDCQRPKAHHVSLRRAEHEHDRLSSTLSIESQRRIRQRRQMSSRGAVVRVEAGAAQDRSRQMPSPVQREAHQRQRHDRAGDRPVPPVACHARKPIRHNHCPLFVPSPSTAVASSHRRPRRKWRVPRGRSGVTRGDGRASARRRVESGLLLR